MKLILLNRINICVSDLISYLNIIFYVHISIVHIYCYYENIGSRRFMEVMGTC